jgi:hypothetical protein
VDIDPGTEMDHESTEAIMGRSILAVLGGLVIAAAVIFGLELLGHILFPHTLDVHGKDPEEVKKAIASLPVAVFLSVLVAWAGGNFAGGFVAAWVARRLQVVHGLLIGLALQGTAVFMMLTVPHPVWFWVASFLACVPLAYLGSRLAPRPPAPPQPRPTESLAA